MGLNPAAAGLLGGMGGGIAQAYATMGEYYFYILWLLAIEWISRILHMYENRGDYPS